MEAMKLALKKKMDKLKGSPPLEEQIMEDKKGMGEMAPSLKGAHMGAESIEAGEIEPGEQDEGMLIQMLIRALAERDSSSEGHPLLKGLAAKMAHKI